MRRGDIYYIKSNYTECGFEQRGDRPAVIVSNDLANAHSGVLEVVYLTTKPKKDLPTHVLINSTHAVSSTVLCEQIHSIDIGRFQNYMGQCTPEEMEKIDKALAVSIGLAHAPKIEAAVECEEDEGEEDEEDDGLVSELQDLCSDLETELAKATTELEVYKRLYADLLEKLTR